MAQGKEFTQEQRDMIIQSLKPHLELGFSRNKACALVGLPPQTLSNWVVNDEALGMLLTSWENTTTALAMATVASAIRLENQSDDPKKENSWRWLDRKEETLKPKQDVTTNDKELPAPIIALDEIRRNHSSQEDSEPRE